MTIEILAWVELTPQELKISGIKNLFDSIGLNILLNQLLLFSVHFICFHHTTAGSK